MATGGQQLEVCHSAIGAVVFRPVKFIDVGEVKNN
jgi:hypothetical protein